MTERELFIAALHQPDIAARAAFLEEVCTDPGLRHRVETLVRDYERLGDFLERLAPGRSASPRDLAQDPFLTPAFEAPVEGPGTIIGSYKLLEQIGEGGMGVVYMAEQTKPIRRKVALKIIKAGMDTKQVIARFEA